MPASVLVLKSCQHSTLSWSNVNTSFVPTFIFVIKLPRHFICIEATSILHPCRIRDNIHLCHETTSTLYLYRGHANITSLPLKLRQHSIFAEAMPTFIFAMKPWQHFIFAEAMPTLHLCHWSHVNTPFSSLKLCQHFIRRSRDNIHEATSKLHLHRSHANIHEAMSTLHIAIEVMSTLYSPKLCQHSYKAIFRGNITQTSRVYSTIARHQDFRDANKMLKMQGDAKTLKF